VRGEAVALPRALERSRHRVAGDHGQEHRMPEELLPLIRQVRELSGCAAVSRERKFAPPAR
jgi:hypothetical protein